MVKLKDNDIAIFSVLDNDGRLTIKQIEKITGISSAVIRYRLKKLLASHVIENFYTTINYRKIDFSIYNILLKIGPSSKKEENDILEFLFSHKNIVYIIKLIGSWDFYIALATKNNTKLNDFLGDLYENFSTLIVNYEILNSIMDYVFSLKYLYPQKFIYKNYMDTMEEYDDKKILLDHLDKVILKLLILKPLISITELIFRTKLSYKTVKSKIKKLFDNNIIIRIRPWINLEKLGYLRFLVFLKLKPESEKLFKKFILLANKIPNIVFISKTIGHYDIVVDLNVKNVEILREVMFSIHKVFHGKLAKVDITPVFQELKTAVTFSKDYSKKLPFD
jgi:DNA-binding Lrp family transcriptional regulator